MTISDKPTTWWRSTVVPSHHGLYGVTCSAVMTPVAVPSVYGMTPRRRLSR
jgi:hypothetical protein